jgi:hypothetical protein
MSVQKFQASVDIYDNGYCELYLNFDWASAPLNLDPLKPDLDGARRLVFWVGRNPGSNESPLRP